MAVLPKSRIHWCEYGAESHLHVVALYGGDPQPTRKIKQETKMKIVRDFRIRINRKPVGDKYIVEWGHFEQRLNLSGNTYKVFIAQEGTGQRFFKTRKEAEAYVKEERRWVG
jgi:hypothetical protein